MTDSSPLHMSEEGFEKLRAELHKMKFVDRPAIVAEIKKARELGDLSENAEYHAAKEAQTHIERVIAELEFKISRAVVVKRDEVAKGKAYLFARVTVLDLDDDEEEIYTLVSAEESKPDDNHISIKSPIGKGLLGKSVGDIVEIQVPAGVLKYKILNIE
ncbi:MAG: transcription elongation factor GreA [candidate division Zixibacteria bacterium]|nr:transcription elongation factor GreA [candidate division Zixibacteria bacterium]